ncbi:MULTISPECIES: fimbrial protein [unclassified Pseudomonas]|uniref:fimbrial protein n=1 Tax=unclassified Pseudomonas TaxID=196821 RepID=UPI0011AED2DB|nr:MULTISPECIES: fimbrial protein [unclassified Pseudomonas]
MMKKLISLGLVWATAVALSSAHAADASDGTINFAGQMIEQTCQVSINGQAGANATIILPTVTTDSLNGPGTQGQTKGDTLLRFTLSGCAGPATKARVFFENTGSAAVYQVGPYAFNLRNTSSDSSAATGVGLQIFDATGASVKMGDLGQRNLPAINLGADIVYSVRYLSVTLAALPGPFSALATYSIDYL